MAAVSAVVHATERITSPVGCRTFVQSSRGDFAVRARKSFTGPELILGCVLDLMTLESLAMLAGVA